MRVRVYNSNPIQKPVKTVNGDVAYVPSRVETVVFVNNLSDLPAGVRVVQIYPVVEKPSGRPTFKKRERVVAKTKAKPAPIEEAEDSKSAK